MTEAEKRTARLLLMLDVLTGRITPDQLAEAGRRLHLFQETP